MLRITGYLAGQWERRESVLSLRFIKMRESWFTADFDKALGSTCQYIWLGEQACICLCFIKEPGAKHTNSCIWNPVKVFIFDDHIF